MKSVTSTILKRFKCLRNKKQLSKAASKKSSNNSSCCVDDSECDSVYNSSLSSLDSMNMRDLDHFRCADEEEECQKVVEIDVDESLYTEMQANSQRDYDDEDDEEEEEGSMDFDVGGTKNFDSGSSFDGSYSISHHLGSGGFANVYKCQSIRSGCTLLESTSTGHDYSEESDANLALAVKVIPADEYNDEEVEALQLLKHCPYIVGALDVFHEADQSYVVMQEMQGGDLLTRIGQKGAYQEDEAKVVMQTLLEAVSYCHSKGVCHRDIKPENILLQSPEDDVTVRLTDFGLASKFNEEEKMTEACGTVLYSAPEVFDMPAAGYDQRVDLWSCGVVLYVLLAGYAPFDGESEEEIIQAVASGEFAFHKRYWKHISQSAKDLIVGLLQVDPSQRISVEEALQCEWMKDV